MKAKFDEYRTTYRDEVQRSIAFAGADLDVFTEAKSRALLQLVRTRLGDPRSARALDVGCGAGETDRVLAPELGALHGVDVSEQILQTARRTNPDVEYRSYDGATLPYADGAFDLAFAICVVHHVRPDRWGAFVAELERVVRPGGIVALIEHNPWNPLTRLAVSRCAFDDDATLLRARTAKRLLERAGIESAETRFIIFQPFRHPRLRDLEDRLGRLPAGAQYVVAGVRP